MSARLLTINGLLVLALALPGGCAREAPALFEEGAVRAGITRTLTCGEPGRKETILEVNGNGAALVDLDADGDLDVVLVDGSTRRRLLDGEPIEHHVLRNEGPRDGWPRFEPCTGTGLLQGGWPTGIAVGDVDRDGRPDLLLGGLGEDALFLNRTDPGGPIRFDKHVLAGRRSSLDWTASVALADADGDGLLDAYLVRYLTIDPADPPLGDVEGIPCRFQGHPVMCGPHGLAPQPDVLLAGLPGPPWFADVTEERGLASVRPGYGLGVLFMDLDDDGWPDLYVANDSVSNVLLHNRGDGRFEDVSLLSGATSDLSGRDQAGMGVDAGDLDRDGDFDLVVSNFSDESNALYRQDRPLMFRDVSAAVGLAERSRPMLGWGVHLADFDSDGWLDLYVANGHVYPEADRPGTGTSYAQPQQLFLGRGDGHLAAAPSFDARPVRGRCSVRGDLDGDGDLDLLTLTMDGAPLLYVNRTDRPGRQMLVTLQDGGCSANGATLRVETDEGPLVRQALGSSGFQGASDPRLHLGGGAPIRAASVRWSGGEVEAIDPAAMMAGRHLVIRRGAGVVASEPLEAVDGARR